MNVIEINNINLSFNKQIIFNNASLAISHPGFYCLVGRNGSGKTTLFNILTNKVKINSGKIIINRDDISYCDSNSLLFMNLTVRENLNLVTNDLDIILSLASKFKIEKLLDVYPKRLSEGERQRVAIIRTILEDKQILLLDEVTSHIDDKNAKIILSYLKELSKDHIIIYTTHFKKEVRIYADSIIKIENHEFILNEIKQDYKELEKNKINNYKPNKLLNKIIRFKPDYIFALIFIILSSFTLSSIWLSSINKVDTMLSVERKSLNPEYSIIDDYSMNIYDHFYKGSYNTGTDVDDRVKELVKRNTSFQLGDKSFFLNIGKDEGNCFIQYYLFDNNLSDNEIICSSDTYEMLETDYSLASNYILTYRKDTFHITIIDGNYPFTFFVTNEYTYKVLSKFKYNYNVSTIDDTSIHLISGRLPENNDEIVKWNMVYGEDTYKTSFGNQEKTFKIVGVYDYVLESIYKTNPYYIVYDEHAFDFKLNASDVVSAISYGFIAYGDTNDLTKEDINYIISNDLYVVNDVMKYAYEAYTYIDNLKGNFVRMLIFVLTLDILTISYYISFWFHSNKDRYQELKRLNKIKLVRKRCILTKFIIGLVIFVVGILLYLLAQKLINQAFLENCFTSENIYHYHFSFINNQFLVFAILLLLIVEFLICFIEVRRSLYD